MRLSTKNPVSIKAGRGLQACNIYISEGKDNGKISALEEVARSTPAAVLVNLFVDEPYNRTGFTIVARHRERVVEAAVKLARAALEKLDLRSHAASHPRLGAVDHISCHPLEAAASELQHAAAVAKDIGKSLSEGPGAVPVFFYGAASTTKARLADIRRDLGYFKGSRAGNWEGNQIAELPPGFKPDLGPKCVQPASGVVLIGASPWVVNYNIGLQTGNMTIAGAIARAISGRSGGLKDVEAIALPHQHNVEIACNLLSGGERLMSEVFQKAEELSSAHGISILNAYRIGKSPEDYVKAALEHLPNL